MNTQEIAKKARNKSCECPSCKLAWAKEELQSLREDMKGECFPSFDLHMRYTIANLEYLRCLQPALDWDGCGPYDKTGPSIYSR